MDRDQLLELRPLIPKAITDKTKELELFQNEILRPILKYQHNFIEIYFKNNAQFLVLASKKTSRLAFQDQVTRFIGSQSNIKNQLIGTVIGLLTDDELTFYWKHSADLNKRIYQMVCQRVSDTFY